MKKIFISSIIGGLITVSTLQAANSKLLTIVTSGDALTQLMSLVLSNQAKDQGADVEVLFCGQAAPLILKNSKETKFKPKDMSPQKLLQKLINSGGSVLICPPYLPNANKTKADLIQGVKVANPSKIAQKLLEQDTKILSY